MSDDYYANIRQMEDAIPSSWLGSKTTEASTLTALNGLDANLVEWLNAALYKLLRIRHHTRSRAKAADDLIDAGAYAALAYTYLRKHGFGPRAYEA